MTVHPAALRRAGNHCDGSVVPRVDVAVGEFAGAATQGMGDMDSAAAARACIDGWHETFREASKAMQAVGDKLRRTGAVVHNYDLDAADLYRGPVPDLPVISVNFTG